MMPAIYQAGLVAIYIFCLFLAVSTAHAASSAPAPFFGFNATFSSHMVLQRQPAKAAVYGVAPASADPPAVNITVATASGDAVYTVPADVTPNPSSSGWDWKALLQPAPAGGNYTITASSGNASAAIMARGGGGELHFSTM